MRSDREELPEGFTKEDADKAEMKEAELQKQASGLRAAVAPGCQVYWPSDFQVCGAIRDKYNSLGAQFSFLGFPTTNELTNPDGFGRRSVFVNGPIYWSAASGAHPVVNHFFAAWQRNNWETGPLGYPTTDEIVNPDGLGRRQEFQNTAAIYWKLNEAWAIRGAIRDKWNTVNAERPGSLLGYPLSDEIVLPDGQGRMNRFERGVLYWHPSHGAHPVVSGILDQWTASGYETGAYGYPTADEVTLQDIARQQQFQNGILYSPKRVAADAAYKDYMQAPAAAQCAAPLGSRVGAWTCTKAGGAAAALPAPPQFNGPGEYCDVNFGGCWNVYDDFRADYQGDVVFGAGPQIIGNGSVVVEWKLAGPYTQITRATVSSNDAVMGRVVFAGALQNGAVGVANGGSLIHSTQPQFAPGPHMTGRAVGLPNPSGMELEDRRMRDHNYVVQISVEFSEWPGYWYFYVRSPVAHYDDDDPNDIYRFMGADQLPGNPVGGDWKW
ncbi:LGFP repeat-containing protein [Rhodococcus jostii]|nr:LGFP repeat-containing protein [Rhodococcus jostii]